MAAEFLAGTKNLAPMAVKAMAQKYVQTELADWKQYFNAYTHFN
jgi:hypothetical protein